MTASALQRVIRRETHSPRTVAAFVAVILLVVVFAYAGLEIVLSMIGRPALLVGPGEAGDWLVALPSAQPVGIVIVVGVALALIGLILVILALAPGRLSRHQMTWGDRAVVVDNGVIASALAQHLSDETGLARDQITVGVAHRTVDVSVRPGAGIPLDEPAMRDLAETEVASYQLTPAVKTRIRVQRAKESEFDS